MPSLLSCLLPWNQLTRWGRLAMWVNYLLMTCGVLSFAELIPLWVLHLAWVAWVLIAFPRMVRDFRQAGRLTWRLRQPHSDLSDLPPELQEEIQMRWAQAVLRERRPDSDHH